MATLAFQKILSNLSSNANVQKLMNNFNQLSAELKKKEAELKTRFDQEKADKIALALKKYQEMIKTLNTSEAKLEKEVNGAIARIKKSATTVEKNIVAYRKKAVAQANKIEKALFAAEKKAKAQAAGAKTTKKASKKTTSTRKKARKTTTKKASR
jgi:hypothetical protein